MKNTPLRSTLLASNTATRLREMLGIPARGRPRKARPAVREQMVIEAIEPRVLLSAEALIVPPPPPAEAQVVADAAGSVPFEAFAGCDRTFATCQSKFGNSLNFGGFPWIPVKNPFAGDSIV